MKKNVKTAVDHTKYSNTKMFRPLMFNESLDKFWTHCRLAKKSDAPSALEVIFKYFTGQTEDRKKREEISRFIENLKVLFSSYIDFYPIYSTCDKISPTQLFFYLWVEPLLNPELLLKLSKKHPLSQSQFVILAETYQQYCGCDRDINTLSELVRSEILDLIGDAGDRHFNLRPNKPPTYYKKMKEELHSWCDFHAGNAEKMVDVERAISLYKSWRLIIEIPKKQNDFAFDLKIKEMDILAQTLSSPPSEHELQEYLRELAHSPKVIEALDRYREKGIPDNLTQRGSLIKLISILPESKLYSLLENTKISNSALFFWSRLKLMNEYIDNQDPDLWLRKTKNSGCELPTYEMQKYSNGVFWPWLLIERIKWDLLKPNKDLRTLCLSTKLLLNCMSRSNEEVSQLFLHIKPKDECLFDEHYKCALNGFNIDISNDGRVDSLLFYIRKFLKNQPENMKLIYKTTANLIAILIQFEDQRYNNIRSEIKKVEDLVMEAFIEYTIHKKGNESKILNLNEKIGSEFVLMLRKEFQKISSEQCLGEDANNLAMFLTAYQYKFTGYTKYNFDIYEKKSMSYGFVNRNVISDAPKITGYSWNALREYNLFISTYTGNELLESKVDLYADPLKRLELNMNKYFDLVEEIKNGDIENVTPIKAAFGSSLKKHLLPEVIDSYPYQMLKNSEFIINMFLLPKALHPSINKYIEMSSQDKRDILAQLPQIYD